MNLLQHDVALELPSSGLEQTTTNAAHDLQQIIAVPTADGHSARKQAQHLVEKRRDEIVA